MPQYEIINSINDSFKLVSCIFYLNALQMSLYSVIWSLLFCVRMKMTNKAFFPKEGWLCGQLFLVGYPLEESFSRSCLLCFCRVFFSLSSHITLFSYHKIVFIHTILNYVFIFQFSFTESLASHLLLLKMVIVSILLWLSLLPKYTHLWSLWFCLPLVLILLGSLSHKASDLLCPSLI